MQTFQNTGSHAKKPQAVKFAQILLYLAAALNVVNGLYSFGSPGFVKKILCAAMILFGIAAIYVAARMNVPEASRRQAAVALAGILIALRIAEYAIWMNFGFLLGIILPVLVIWRLNGAEAKAWYRS